MASYESVEESVDMRQFLSFFLDDEVFAFDVSRVREVLDRTELTRVPRMPAFMRGVLNLRGSVLPVVDLGVRFGMGAIDETLDTCIIVVDVDVEGESTVLGAMVDAVDQVFDLPSSALDAPPKIGAKLQTEFIEALGRRGDEFIIVLNVDRVFSADEIIAVRKASISAPAAASSKTSKKKAEE